MQILLPFAHLTHEFSLYLKGFGLQQQLHCRQGLKAFLLKRHNSTSVFVVLGSFSMLLRHKILQINATKSFSLAPGLVSYDE